MAHLTKKKAQPSFIRKDWLIGQVTIGTKQQSICIPRNSTITIPGYTNKLQPRITCLVEQVEHHNLPLGIVINWCMAMPKARTIPVIIINTNRCNVWIRQPLLAAELFDVECDEIEYRANMNQEGNNISVGFQPVPPQLIGTNSCQVDTGPIQCDVPKIGKEANFTQDQQSHFINLVYDNKEVFSLHDEDLVYCDLIIHLIPTATEKAVYLPHHTIPRQLQGGGNKCIDAWLCEGIIRPSKSPYGSQVVIVHKKSGEIHLCVDYQKLNSITVRDAFPLSRIDEALQAVHSNNWFMSFVLTQGYLQLAMEEGDIQKTASRARSSGIYRFTCMPFGLSNAGSSFCHLMEQSLGD